MCVMGVLCQLSLQMAVLEACWCCRCWCALLFDLTTFHHWLPDCWDRRDWVVCWFAICCDHVGNVMSTGGSNERAWTGALTLPSWDKFRSRVFTLVKCGSYVILLDILTIWKTDCNTSFSLKGIAPTIWGFQQPFRGWDCTKHSPKKVSHSKVSHWEVTNKLLHWHFNNLRLGMKREMST